ncbi:MAG: ribonuclease III [Dehalococcoidales bacterium]|nr:ribonuclease III [Dehalococcoidales bacterium]
MAFTNLAALEQSLGISFNDISLLEQALVHSSYINENPGLISTSNERLEFLGDAVLGLIIAEKLYQDNPGFSEGEMTRFRAALVRRDTLARVAKTIKLGDYLYLGKGEEASGGRHKPANLAAALEAVIAALYLDQGLSRTTGVVLRLFGAETEKLLKRGREMDYKSELQELTQSREQKSPTYQVIETRGPDHDKSFVVEVRLAGTVLGRGSGKSKKEAETEAARSALEQFKNGFTQ